ncbi:arginase family protein [uncultured Jannaschia sp.]|uniref:arginase family protein n=1 Tax=uncultured Jannaschia sp. TaxID=293347 RepID=UPI0026021F81|nr:arginase family protein [uncultured Jannaschia sp.]
MLRVSLDADSLDLATAPAVGITLPGEATFRGAHPVMEKVHDSGVVTLLDFVGPNPLLEDQGRAASSMVDPAAPPSGRRAFVRPAYSHS